MQGLAGGGVQCGEARVPFRSRHCMAGCRHSGLAMIKWVPTGRLSNKESLSSYREEYTCTGAEQAKEAVSLLHMKEVRRE